MLLADGVTVPGGPGRRANRIGRCWRAIGIDLWAVCPAGTDPVVAVAPSVAERTDLRMSAFGIPDAGGAIAGDDRARLWMRFVAREDDGYLTDEAIGELLTGLAGRMRWSKLTKLEERDGVPAFMPLVSQ